MSESRELVQVVRAAAKALEVAIQAAIAEDIGLTLTFQRGDNPSVCTQLVHSDTHIIVSARQARDL